MLPVVIDVYSKYMGDHITSDDVKDEGRHVLDSIRRLLQELRWADREAESRLGLSGAQLFVLERLGESDGMSVNELAKRTRTHQSSVSVVVHRLAEKRLVTRKASALDRRRAELSLTSAGRRMLVRSVHSPQDRLIEAVESMPAVRRKQLAERLAEVVETMGLSDSLPGMFFEPGMERHRDEG